MAIALAALFLLAAAQSPAETIRVGGSSRGGGSVHLLLDAEGRVQRGVVKWTAFCPRTNSRLSAASGFTMRRLRAPGRFAVKGSYRAHGHGYRERISISARGRDHVSRPRSADPPSARWTGRFRVRAVVFQHGRYFDSCSTGRHRWRGRALLRNDADTVDATGSLVMTGDQGDYILGSGTVSYSAPPTPFRVLAYGRRIALSPQLAPPEFWNVTLRGPAGSLLHTGTYANATREPFSGDGAGLDVWGEGRGCNEVTGSFTINSLRLDRYYQVVNADISFEQHCEGAPPALHGRLILNL